MGSTRAHTGAVGCIGLSCLISYRVYRVKYLGVWISCDLSWTTHVSKVCYSLWRDQVTFGQYGLYWLVLGDVAGLSGGTHMLILRRPTGHLKPLTRIPSWTQLTLIAAGKVGGLSYCALWMSVYPKLNYPTGVILPWLSKDLVHSIRKRNYHYRLARRTGRPEHEAKYKKLRNKVVFQTWEGINLTTQRNLTAKTSGRPSKLCKNRKSSIPTLSGTISSERDQANAMNIHTSQSVSIQHYHHSALTTVFLPNHYYKSWLA